MRPLACSDGTSSNYIVFNVVDVAEGAAVRVVSTVGEVTSNIVNVTGLVAADAIETTGMVSKKLIEIAATLVVLVVLLWFRQRKQRLRSDEEHTLQASCTGHIFLACAVVGRDWRSSRCKEDMTICPDPIDTFFCSGIVPRSKKQLVVHDNMSCPNSLLLSYRKIHDPGV